MVTKQQDWELGGANGVDVTTGNQGGGDVMQLSKTGTGTCKYTTASIRGSKSVMCDAPASTDVVYVYWNAAGTSATEAFAGEVEIPSLPSADQSIAQIYQGGGMLTVKMRTTGRIAVENAAATSIGVSPIGTPFVSGDFPLQLAVDMTLDAGTSTTTGKAKTDIYVKSVPGGSALTPSLVTPWWSMGEITATNVYRTGFVGSDRIGKLTSGAVWSVKVDTLKSVDAYGLLGTYSAPVNNPPVVTSPSGQTVQCGAVVTVVATAVDPEGNAMTNGWQVVSYPADMTAPTFSSGGTGSGATATGQFTFSSTVPGNVVVRPFFNDGTNPTQYGAAVKISGYKADGSSYGDLRAGSSWTGTAAAVFDAANDATYDESPSAPSGAVRIYDMRPIKPGDAVFTVRLLRQPGGGAAATCQVEILTGSGDTVAATRTITATTSMVTTTITLNPTENTAFSDHNVWAIRLTATE